MNFLVVLVVTGGGVIQKAGRMCRIDGYDERSTN